MARLKGPSTRSLYFINTTRAINLDGVVEDITDDIVELDIMYKSWLTSQLLVAYLGENTQHAWKGRRSRALFRD